MDDDFSGTSGRENLSPKNCLRFRADEQNIHKGLGDSATKILTPDNRDPTQAAMVQRDCPKCDRLLRQESEFMKRAFTSPDSAEVGLLKNMLQKAGIRCVELNEQMAQTIPSPPFQAELWVENEGDYTEAVALIEDWLSPVRTAGASWSCSRCGEQLGSQFTKCWKCGTKRDTTN